ncbi:MAG: GH3 auxin-responsive promoter family protein, partial [Lachnospiraceae bacterium]|nr:GH3 auxin-responsive promoter family protein [Lachnospiraceae bacterium]
MKQTFNPKAFKRICESGKKFVKKHEELMSRPRESQFDFLMRLLSENKDTEFGKKHNFANIKSYEDYVREVPLTDYDDYLPYIDRMIDNKETDLISCYPIVHYASSSGSTGVPKRIPISIKNINLVSSYAAEIIFARLNEQIENQGKEIGPICFLPDFYWDYIDDNTTIGSISAQIGYNFRDDFLSINTSPEPLQYLQEHSADATYIKALFALQHRDLSCIYSTFSSVTYEFIHTIETNWSGLVDDIRNGTLDPNLAISDELREKLEKYLYANPERANELQAEFEKGFNSTIIPRIWPNLAMYCSIGGSFFAEYTKKIQILSGDIPFHHLCYVASESMFAIARECDDPTYSPLLDDIFFEFRSIDEDDGKIYLMDELEVGKDYEIIISNMSGFYRYRMYDVFHIDKIVDKTPQGHIAFRLNQMVNMVGEHVSTEDLEFVIKGLNKADNTHSTEYALYTDYSTAPGRYILLIEPDIDMGKGVQPHLASVADDLFKKANRSYNKYREQNTLGGPQIIYLEPSSFHLFKDVQVAGGISANQVKPVRLIDNKQKEQFFFGLSEGPYKAMKRVVF